MRLWFPILITPLVALAQQAANYALVPLACEKQQHLPIHFVAATAFVLSVLGIAMAWGAWRDSGVQQSFDHGDTQSRVRFLALLGVVISALMALTILAQWGTAAFIPPCVR